MRAQRYETLGLRRLYVWVAGIVHEPILPATYGEIGDWAKSGLIEAREKTHYFGAANLARSACYVPQAIAFFLFQYWPGLAYVAFVWICHGLLVAVEGYKRKLCDLWIPKAPEAESKPARMRPEAPKELFRLRKFETEQFYKRIGIEYFRRFAVWMMTSLTYGFTGKRMTFIAQPTRWESVAFEKETRISEAVHLSSAVSVAPLVVLSWLGAPLGIALWSTFIVIGDLLLSLLQRYHRTRVWPLIARMLERQK